MEEQKILTKMKKLRDNNKSYSEIATVLNKEDIPTRYTKENKKSSWYPSTVRNILNRRDVIIENEKEETWIFKNDVSKYVNQYLLC